MLKEYFEFLLKYEVINKIEEPEEVPNLKPSLNMKPLYLITLKTTLQVQNIK
jgi:hypothetical protein